MRQDEVFRGGFSAAEKRRRHQSAEKFRSFCRATARLNSYAAFVGWAKTSDANASGGVPTIRPCIWIKMVGTAQERLCPPCDSVAIALLRIRIMSDEDHEGLMETVHLLKSPANTARLLRSIRDADRGKVKNHEIVEPEEAGSRRK